MSAWAELVFHVLAHVPSGAAASAHDPTWIAHVEGHAGPARDRHLAEDAAVLGAAAATHDALAELQVLAWLFDDPARAAACADRTLAELTDVDVDDPTALRGAAGPSSAAAEILRAAAELECDVLASLPPVTPLPIDYTSALAAAPWLARFSVEHLRPLRIRGRVRGSRIFVGVPSTELAVTGEHVAWQAAHEATVAEVHRRARSAGLTIAHDPLEHTALTLLAERADAAGAREAHARWIAQFRVPPVHRDALDPAWRALLDQSADARR